VPASPPPPPTPPTQRPTRDPTLIASDCAPAMLDTLRSSAKLAFEAGNYATAESRFELLYRCGDANALAQDFMAACNAQQADHARQLYVKLPVGQRQLKQICLRDGIDPEKP
jgi:hypothetical protein